MHSPYLYISIVDCIMIGPEETEQPENEQQGAELFHLDVSSGGAAEDEGQIFELPECPDHYPTSFVKGKPRCIYPPFLCSKVDCYINYCLYSCITYRS
jgi:hypothetical protein